MKPKYGLLLAPGAGADSSSPALLAVEAALPPKFAVHRMDFPYRKAGRKAPDRQLVLLQAISEELAEFCAQTGLQPNKVFMGGRSMGGRMCSIAAAEGLGTAGLVLMSYPLHPPGRPEKLRVDHFPGLDVPCLFVSGTRDTFGTVDEFTAHTSSIPGEVEHVWIEGGDHGMKRHDVAVAAAAADWLSRHTR